MTVIVRIIVVRIIIVRIIIMVVVVRIIIIIISCKVHVLYMYMYAVYATYIEITCIYVSVFNYHTTCIHVYIL